MDITNENRRLLKVLEKLEFEVWGEWFSAKVWPFYTSTLRCEFSFAYLQTRNSICIIHYDCVEAETIIIHNLSCSVY